MLFVFCFSFFFFPSLNLKIDVLKRDQQAGKQEGSWDGLSCLLVVICGGFSTAVKCSDCLITMVSPQHWAEGKEHVTRGKVFRRPFTERQDTVDGLCSVWYPHPHSGELPSGAEERRLSWCEAWRVGATRTCPGSVGTLPAPC